MVSVINQRLRADIALAEALVAGNVMYVQLFAGKQRVTDLLVDVLVYGPTGGAEDTDALAQFAEINSALFC